MLQAQQLDLELQRQQLRLSQDTVADLGIQLQMGRTDTTDKLQVRQVLVLSA